MYTNKLPPLTNANSPTFSIEPIGNSAKLKDSIQNLEGALKLKPDPNKPHGVILMYFNNGRRVKQYFDDIVTAKQAKQKIAVECTKFVSKYSITL